MGGNRAEWLRGLTIAHRGLHDSRNGGRWMENGASAFAAAIASGFGIECDVRLSSDGQAVVFHDETLDRLTHVSGRLAGYPAAVLSRIPINGTRDTIQPLSVVLHQIDAQVPLLIEIKTDKRGRYQPICTAVAQALELYDGDFAVISFDSRVLKWFGKNQPEVVRGLVLERNDFGGFPLIRRWRRGRAVGRSRPDFLAVDWRALPNGWVARRRRRGMPVAAWTVCDAETRAFALHYADAVIAEAQGMG
ncbi:glycerophosphodiester phosphodiesterase [Novosphingobium sp. FSY-8]|uniref:Glycerophosphodiester phosphodiesterase n=1 Tax=Novosphingobium ovatum TaxID=1908523 RepID=A0ABW9XGJ9_9SPHN|nr:glycerophosphodiester phosphodiesterase family protein [Novosphingobium ovatum]NBC37671.1 glycerophosphodiester phosphodiesterase [Novosphingobium ovatum]